MLTLAFPAALGFLAALLLVAFFYFLRMRYRRQPVSSVFLWQLLARANEGGARLKYRTLMLLVLQVLAVSLLVLALAGLAWVRAFPARPGTLYLIDASASMAAREAASGTPRFDRAVEAVKADLATLDPLSPVAFFLVDQDLHPLGGGRTFQASQGVEIAALLKGAGPGFGPLLEGNVAGALAAWIQTRPGPWSGALATDGGFDLGGSRLGPVFDGRLRSLPVTGDAPNVGITDLRVGSFPGPGVRASFFNGFPTDRPVHLVLGFNDRPLLRLSETLAPGTTSLTLPVPEVGSPAAVGTWTLALEEASDALAGDDRFTVSVAPPRPARILYLGEPVPFLKASFPGADWQETRTIPASTGTWDFVVAGGDLLPPDWKGSLVTFGALPPGAPVFWGEGVAGPLAGSPAAHPLSRWVPWSEVRVDAGRGLVVGTGASVLASASGWPLVAAWDKDGAQFLVLGTDVLHSNLGMTAALPILMKNFRQAVVPQEGNPLADTLRVGEPADRAGGPGWHVVSSTAPGGTQALGAVRRGGLWTLTAREPGTYGWVDGSDRGTLAVNLPAGESDTAPRPVPGGGAGAVPPGQAERRFETLSLVGALALLVLVLLAAEWRLWNGRLAPRANPGLGALRAASALAALLALTGFSPVMPTDARNLVLLFDTSDSLGPDLVDQERESARTLVERLAPGDRVALVAFASTPRVLSGLVPRDQGLQALETLSLAPSSADDAGSTDIPAALAAGAQLLAGAAGSGSQYLFTDGRTNRGGGLDTLTGPARSYPVSAVPLGRPLSGVAGQGLGLPATARPGERVAVRWTGWTDQDRPVTATLVVDGRVLASRRAVLTAGSNTLEFLCDAGESGTRKVEVQVADDRGQALASAGATGLLSVEGRARALVIRGGRSGGGLAAALATQGYEVSAGGPAQVPVDQAGYQGLAAVVLDNVSAPSLTAVQQNQLRDWVSGGGGLLVVGGDASLGRGEYFSTPLEDLLPVQTDTRQRLQFTRSRILFVVDHSGSMSEGVGTTTKLKAALGGIDQSLDELTSQDEVGLLEFDTEATWILPFTPLTQKKAVRAALDTFGQGGGTDMTRALEEVITAFGHPGPVKRHVVLMTDGQTGGEERFFQEFSRKLKAAQVTLTIVGIGNEVNDALLRALAEAGAGLYYRADQDQIPSILHKETVRVTRNLIQEGTFVPQAVGHDPVQDLGTEVPPVRGYLVTRAKPLARVLWEARRDDGSRDPLVADWRFGAGRVAVVTTDSGSRWLAGWSGQPVYNRFWGQTVRSLESGSRDKTLRVDLDVTASVARVVVEALDDRGALRTGASLTARAGEMGFSLKETSPGRYEAAIPLGTPGLQVVSVADRTGPGRSWAWAWNPPGAELSRGGADWAGLGRLASTTGGLLQPLAAPAPPEAVLTWASGDLRGWWLLAALVLFLVELGWRSTSLGQFTQARALFLAWWADQARPWVKPEVVFTPRATGDDEKRTREAYRALAERRKNSI